QASRRVEIRPAFTRRHCVCRIGRNICRMGFYFLPPGHRKRRQYFRRQKRVSERLSGNNEIFSAVLEKTYTLALPQPTCRNACPFVRQLNLALAPRTLADQPRPSGRHWRTFREGLSLVA